MRQRGSDGFIHHQYTDIRHTIRPGQNHQFQLEFVASASGDYELIASIEQLGVGDFRENDSQHLKFPFEILE